VRHGATSSNGDRFRIGALVVIVTGTESSPLRRSGALAAIAILGAVSSSCESGPTLYGNLPSVGRDEQGALTLIGIPCSGEVMTAVAIVAVDEDGSETPALRLGLEPPMDAWDVVVPLDPLELDRPEYIVEVFDEDLFADSLARIFHRAA
jgi:hypothetical protein